MFLPLLSDYSFKRDNIGKL